MTKIENEIQYNAVMARIEELLPLVSDDTPLGLAADYEDVHYPIKKPSLIAVLKLRMFELGLSQCALAQKLGMNQSKISDILSGKSEPTLHQARRMVEELNISPSVVLGVGKNR